MADISLTGLNYFQIGGNEDAYTPTLKDINGNLYKQVIIEINVDTESPGIGIMLPLLSDIGYSLDTKLVVVCRTANVDGCTIFVPMSADRVNGTTSIGFTSGAQPGSSITLVPVDAQNWSAVLTETYLPS